MGDRRSDFFSFWFKYKSCDDNDIVINQDDNKFLRSIGVNADIIFTPGHTRDSMCVLCEDKTAFVGDAAMNFGSINSGVGEN